MSNSSYNIKGRFEDSEQLYFNIIQLFYLVKQLLLLTKKKGGLKYANVRIKQYELVNRTGYTTNDILNIIQDLIKDGLFERLKGKIGKSKFAKHKIFKKDTLEE